MPNGTCVENSTFVCNGDADCPAGSSGGLCIFPAVSPGGILCRSDAECFIPATDCEERTGACCEFLTGVCDDDVLQADCLGRDPSLQPNWTKLGLCADLGCTADLGACCDADTFGTCTDTIYAACQGGKLVWTKNVLCADVTCVHAPIPTVSEWGIAVLTLLLLIGAKVYFGRRQAATA
jgi:hypothetical protein